jgi:hypothetical protein
MERVTFEKWDPADAIETRETENRIRRPSQEGSPKITPGINLDFFMYLG